MGVHMFDNFNLSKVFCYCQWSQWSSLPCNYGDAHAWWSHPPI